jgi:excisionase family DNA binding protein
MDSNDIENDRNQLSLDELITLSEAARICGLSHDHLRRLAGRGDLKAKKIGRDWVTTERSVREYLAQNRRPGPKPQKRT